MSRKIKVVKRDGSLENFDNKKIIKVLKAAGLAENKSRLVAKKVEVLFKTSAKEQISSLEIKDKILDELKQVNQYIASLFDWYEKSKEV